MFNSRHQDFYKISSNNDSCQLPTSVAADRHTTQKISLTFRTEQVFPGSVRPVKSVRPVTTFLTVAVRVHNNPLVDPHVFVRLCLFVV